jgi:hypothetical protein
MANKNDYYDLVFSAWDNALGKKDWGTYSRYTVLATKANINYKRIIKIMLFGKYPTLKEAVAIEKALELRLVEKREKIKEKANEKD